MGFLVHLFAPFSIKWNPIRNSSAPKIKSAKLKNTRIMQSHLCTYTHTHTQACTYKRKFEEGNKSETHRTITCSDFIVCNIALGKVVSVRSNLIQKDMDTASIHIQKTRKRERERHTQRERMGSRKNTHTHTP